VQHFAWLQGSPKNLNARADKYAQLAYNHTWPIDDKALVDVVTVRPATGSKGSIDEASNTACYTNVPSTKRPCYESYVQVLYPPPNTRKPLLVLPDSPCHLCSTWGQQIEAMSKIHTLKMVLLRGGIDGCTAAPWPEEYSD
jgi:hypothetical protein